MGKRHFVGVFLSPATATRREGDNGRQGGKDGGAASDGDSDSTLLSFIAQVAGFDHDAGDVIIGTHHVHNY